MKCNGIRHIVSAPYHPSTNGLVERAVQTFKTAVRKNTSRDIETALSRFLFHYRTTPHSTTGISPAEMLMGRRVRTHLDLLRPNVAKRVQEKQAKQKQGHDSGTKQRRFAPKGLVFIRNIGNGPTWIAGTIMQNRGPLSFLVQLEGGWMVHHHIDHVRV